MCNFKTKYIYLTFIDRNFLLSDTTENSPEELKNHNLLCCTVLLQYFCIKSFFPHVLLCGYFSNHQGATPLVLAKRRGVNKDVIRLLESLEEQEVKGFNRGAHSKLETMQTAESERYLQNKSNY